MPPILTWLIVLLFIPVIIVTTSPISNATTPEQVIKSPETGANDSLRVTIGSMLNVTCVVNEDCILKNSFCSMLTNRCECDVQTMESNSVCQVIYCSSSPECQTRFPNTVCNYGHCQCQFGLKANGQCISGVIPGLDSSHATNGSLAEVISRLPSWSFPAIILGAVFSGAVGSRSPLFSQIFQHLIAIIVLVARAVKKGQDGTNLPAKVVAEVVGEMVEVPLNASMKSTGLREAKQARSSVSSGGGVLENCHHVHAIQLNCDSQDV